MVDTQDYGEEKNLDQLMLATVKGRQSHSTLIVCFFTGGATPPHCAGMLREPAPPVGSRLTIDFPEQIDAAIELNPSIHDGAVIVGRNCTTDAYTIRGWSYRLFPPSNKALQEPNRGSAFNSGLAMSLVEGVDAIYLSSIQGVSRFVRGSHTLLG